MKPKFGVFLTALLLASLACQFAGQGEPTTTATASIVPTDTSTPTKTATVTPDRTATAEVRATQEMDHILEFIAPDLEFVGYSVDEGHLGWEMTSPVEIEINEGGNWRYWEKLSSPNPVFNDFILAVDVSWESETGVAGCNILFRAEEDAGDGEYIVFETLRLSGYPGWDFAHIKFNTYLANLTGSVRSNAAIRLDSGSTNHYVIVAKGPTVSAYANGTRLGSATMPLDVVEGRIFLEAWQESRATTCTFSNAWVWELPEGN